MAIHLFFSSLTQGIIILNEDSNTTVMFWLVGSLNGLKWTAVLSVMPLLILALIITMLLGRQLTIMELGDDIAKGLGQKTLIRIIVGLLVIVLAGASVSIVGPIIGLIVPHIVKRYISKDYFLMVPLTFDRCRFIITIRYVK